MREKNIGIILAAGLGTRLRPITYEKPKPLIEILGKPILEYQLESFKTAHIEKIIIVTGYMSDKIRTYVANKKSKK